LLSSAIENAAPTNNLVTPAIKSIHYHEIYSLSSQANSSISSVVAS
jgi:hypothetical protein